MKPCPDCKLTMEPVEKPAGVRVTLRDKRARWALIVSVAEIAMSRSDPLAEAKLQLRHEQKKAGTCRCDGTGLVPIETTQ